MANSWRRDREQLIAWAEEKEKKHQEGEGFAVSKGNLAVVSGVSLAFVAALYYYTSESPKTTESLLGAVDEEIDVEEEYDLYTDDDE